MLQKQIKLIELKEAFLRSLKDIYSPKELEILFFLLLEKRLQISKLAFHINPQREVSLPLEWEKSLLRLKDSEPIQYILEECYFFKRKFKVSKDVLIPRPETEGLVLWVLESIKTPTAQILDVGTGSGCIAISIKKEKPSTLVTAMDISTRALSICQQNANKENTAIETIVCDMLHYPPPKLHKKFELVVSNPPYIPKRERGSMAKNVTEYEPRSALFVPDENPLVYYQAIAKNCRDFYLKSKGAVLVEIHSLLAKETESLFVKMGFSDVTLRKDSFGKYRMIRAYLP